MTKHTPGPWIAYDFAADWWVANPEDDSGPMLRVGSDHARREANAHLIAAAPELFEAAMAIKKALEYGSGFEMHEEFWSAIKLLDVAIASATGESHD